MVTFDKYNEWNKLKNSFQGILTNNLFTITSLQKRKKKRKKEKEKFVCDHSKSKFCKTKVEAKSKYRELHI